MKLYRGITREYEKNYLNRETLSDYECYTDNLKLAKCYGDYVYEIDIDDNLISDEILNKNGERNFIVNNEKPCGLFGISGKEYIVYTGHDNYENLNIKKVDAKIFENFIELKLPEKYKIVDENKNIKLMRIPAGLQIGDIDLSGGMIPAAITNTVSYTVNLETWNVRKVNEYINSLEANNIRKVDNYIIADYNRQNLEDNAIDIYVIKDGEYQKIAVDIDVLNDKIEEFNREFSNEMKIDVIEDEKESEIYNYKDAVKSSILDYVENYVNYHDYNSLKDMSEKLYDELINSDYITGNASGSYTFNRYEAEENIAHNLELLGKALEYFNKDGSYLKEYGAEACDVTIRCYLVEECLEEVIEEIEEEFEKTIEKEYEKEVIVNEEEFEF